MQTMNLDKFRDALSRAAGLKGEAGMIAQKKLILDSYMIVDAEGMAIDPETIDVHLMPAAPAAEAEVETDAEKPQENEMEDMKKTVRAEIAAQIGQKTIVTAGAPVAPWDNAKMHKGLKNFTSKQKAFEFGSWVLGALGHRKSAEFCKNNGLEIRTKAHLEGTNSLGGFLVPEPLEAELITLREQYGVFRRNARVWGMTADTLRIPKRSAGLTAYFVGEANAVTESTQTFDSINLVAKKLGVLSTVSTELLEDSVISIADDLAGEIAYAFAQKEDDCGFNGDGTSTYGGIVGLSTALSDATYQISDGAATALSGVTLAEINAAFAKLPNWAYQRNGVKVYCHKSVYHNVFERLAMAAGGVTAAEIASGTQPRFFGYPVEFAQVMPSAPSGGGATFAYIGDLSQGCYFGDRRSTSIAFSDSALNAFEQDERVVRGTQRFDIVCANVGSSSAAGAMVKLTL